MTTTNGASATQPIFRWNGQYYGFMSNGYLMDSSGTYRGWIEHDGSVWHSSGNFFGDLVGGVYVLINQSDMHENKPKRLTPTAVALPPKPENRPARSARSGYVDGLDACN